MWPYVFYAVLAIFIYKSIPKPQNVNPVGLGDFNVPTADPSRDIPVIFGTVDIKSPNVVWYGNLRSVPVKKKGGKK